MKWDGATPGTGMLARMTRLLRSFPLWCLVLGVVGGLACRAAAAVVPAPWPALLTTSATWGLLVWLLQLLATRVCGAQQQRGPWLLGGASCLVAVLLTSGAWIAPLTIASAVVAGVVVGWLGWRVHRGERVWVGAIGGLLLGEGVYGVLRQLAPEHHSVHYWSEAAVGLLVCGLAGRQWSRAAALALAMGVAIGLACLGYDAIR